MGSQWQRVMASISFLGIFMLLILIAHAKAENRTDPTANQNLSPLEGWRSAEFCLQNTSIVCSTKYTLKASGWLNVSKEDGPTFCAVGGCAYHTRTVLLCIEHVKKDYWFANNATTKDLKDTIDLGCTYGFTGVSKYRSHGLNLKPARVVAAMSSAVFLLISLF